MNTANIGFNTPGYYEMKVIDTIIPEPVEMKESDFEQVIKIIKQEIETDITKMQEKTKAEIVEERYQKFRNLGEFITL